MGGGAQLMKRTSRIKFPKRHSKPSSDSTSQPKANSVAGEVPQTFSPGSKQSSMTGGGEASLQPRRTLPSQEEIECILIGGCI